MNIVCRTATGAIRGYRRWVGPLFPPRCRFFPTCSEYALEALERYGFLRGVGLTMRRLLRCHPYHPGGIDPVP
jgi:putative membrane protein insertion efficiency factor